jgi:hypothetical protein
MRGIGSRLLLDQPSSLSNQDFPKLGSFPKILGSTIAWHSFIGSLLTATHSVIVIESLVLPVRSAHLFSLLDFRLSASSVCLPACL